MNQNNLKLVYKILKSYKFYHFEFLNNELILKNKNNKIIITWFQYTKKPEEMRVILENDIGTINETFEVPMPFSLEWKIVRWCKKNFKYHKNKQDNYTEEVYKRNILNQFLN